MFISSVTYFKYYTGFVKAWIYVDVLVLILIKMGVFGASIKKGKDSNQYFKTKKLHDFVLILTVVIHTNVPMKWDIFSENQSHQGRFQKKLSSILFSNLLVWVDSVSWYIILTSGSKFAQKVIKCASNEVCSGGRRNDLFCCSEDEVCGESGLVTLGTNVCEDLPLNGTTCKIFKSFKIYIFFSDNIASIYLMTWLWAQGKNSIRF